VNAVQGDSGQDEDSGQDGDGQADEGRADEGRAGARHVSTLPRPHGLDSIRRGRLGRRLFVVALVVFLGLGVLGLYGVRTSEAKASGGGYDVTVSYASISRPGLATPWAVEIRRRGGFGDGLVTVALSSSYFDAFDENSLDPDPVESISDGDRTIWRFQPPPGDVTTVSFDGRVQPDIQLTSLNGQVSVLDDAGAEVVTVAFRTFVMP
jgi:hypothetical protein